MALCIKCKGVLNFTVQGRSIRLQSDGDVTLLVSNQRRTEAYDGEFTMEDRNPRIEVTVIIPVDMYVRYFQEICNVPLVLELCDGRTFSTEHASNIAEDAYDAKKNTQKLTLITNEIVELLPLAA